MIKLNYDINYLQKVLFNLCNNPYGIKYSNHYLRKSYQRDIDRRVADEKLLSEVPVGIQKTLGYGNRFELIFEFNNNDDLIYRGEYN